MVKNLKKCRTCRSPRLRNFLSLGKMAMVNNFLTSYQLNESEPRFPLTVCHCLDCGLVQTREVVNPIILFRNYVYISSFSKTMSHHFQHLAQSIVSRFKLTSESLVTEIGSNDGTLLKLFKNLGVRVLGIDPAENLAKVANQNGIETWDTFFSSKVARRVVKEKSTTASIVIGTNVFAHIDNLEDILKGLGVILGEKGVFVAEFPYLVDLIQEVQFDTIYHEHLSYFSLKPLVALFNRYNFEIFDVERTPVHGGSVIIYVKKKGAVPANSENVKQLLALEEKLKIHDVKTLKSFANKVKKIKTDLIRLLTKLKKQNKKIVGFGAPAKGNILLNYCNIDNNLLDYLVDNIPYKHGLYSPGVHLQVFPEEKIQQDKPDYILLLAWNFQEEILRKLDTFRKQGGKVIVRIPKVQIL